MNVFLPFASPLETAKCLDKRRLNKQIIECRQMLAALEGKTKAWLNHPATQMYNTGSGRIFLYHYIWVLQYYRHYLECGEIGELYACQDHDKISQRYMPSFITQDFLDQMKRRLYTKDPIHYAQFAEYGTSDENWYVVDGELRNYVNGKRIN